MNIRELRDDLDRATETVSGARPRVHESADVVIRVEDPDTGDARWLEVAAVGIAFVNGRFVLQLAAGERDGEPGVHW